jgi:hypothetical protein
MYLYTYNDMALNLGGGAKLQTWFRLVLHVFIVLHHSVLTAINDVADQWVYKTIKFRCNSLHLFHLNRSNRTKA